MDLLRYLAVPEGAATIEDSNPQGKTPEELHAILEQEEANEQNKQATMNNWAKERNVSLMGHAAHTWREESIVKVGWDKLVDASERYNDTYDPTADINELPDEWPQEYKDAMADAKNPEHFRTLQARYQNQIDYNTEGEYLGGKGTAVKFAAMIAHPETLLLGAGEAAVLSKLALKTAGQRFLAGAAIGGLSNTAQELAIIANNKSRDKMGAVIAFGTGAALGGTISAFTRGGSVLDETIKAKTIIGKEYSRAAEADLNTSTKRTLYAGRNDSDTLSRGQLEGAIAHDPTTGKWYVGHEATAMEVENAEEAVRLYRMLKESGGYGQQAATIAAKVATEGGTIAEPAEAAAEALVAPKLSLADADRIAADIPKQKAYTGPLKSIGTEGMASENPFERLLTWKTMEYTQGTGGKTTAEQSAALTADMLTHQMRSHFHPERLRAVKAWQREMKIKSTPWDEGVSNTFDREVFKEIHYRRYPDSRPTGTTANQHVKRIADLYEEAEVNRFKMQQEAGVYGYKGIEPDKLHTTNAWDPTRLARMARERGKEFTINLIKKGILASKEFERTAKYGKLGGKFGAKLTDEFKEERAHYMAKAVFERFMRRPNTVNLARSSHIRVKDRKLLEQRLAEAINDPHTLEHIMHSVDAKDSRVLHEYMQQIEVNLNATQEGVSLSDLMDLDLGRQLDGKFRQAAGRAAMAKKGFKDESSWNEITELVGQWYQKHTNLSEDQIKKQVGKMQKLWKVVLGQNLEETPDSPLARTMRGLRRAASLSSMSQVGFAQTAEFGRLMGSIGVKAFMQQIPQLKNMRRQMLNGTFKDPMLRDIEAAFGVRIGDNHLLHHPLIMADSGGYGVATKDSGKFLKGLDTLTAKGMHVQGYINGMNMVTRMQQRMHARGFFMRMHDDVMKGQRIGRYKDLGLDEPDLATIKQQFAKHSTTTKGWFGQERLAELNLAAFNPDISEKLALAFHKSQSQAVQRNLGGETGWFLEGTFGKMLSQFRTFPIVALEKQTIHDLKFMDTESFTTLMASFGFATMAYMAKTYANSFGMDKRKRKQYMKNRIGTPAKIAAGASGWMGQTSLTPELFGSVLGMTNLDNPFRYTDYKGARFRQYSKGLSLDQLGPGASYFNNAYRFATGMHAAFMNGEELADHTLRRGVRLIPFNNALGMVNAANKLIGD